MTQRKIKLQDSRMPSIRMPSINEAMGAFFRYKRLAAGISEKQVCHYLGLPSEMTLRSYEAGKASIPLNQMYALSNCLNIAPDEIMDLMHNLSRLQF